MAAGAVTHDDYSLGVQMIGPTYFSQISNGANAVFQLIGP